MLRFMDFIPNEQIYPIGIAALEVLVEAIAGILRRVFLAWFGARAYVAGFLPQRSLTAFACALAALQPFLTGVVH